MVMHAVSLGEQDRPAQRILFKSIHAPPSRFVHSDKAPLRVHFRRRRVRSALSSGLFSVSVLYPSIESFLIFVVVGRHSYPGRTQPADIFQAR